MHPQRAAGMILVIAGIVVMCMGIDASNSLSDQWRHALTGHFTRETTRWIIGGMAIALIGLFISIAGPGNDLN